MKHLAAYLLLQQGGNEAPSAKDIKAVLESVGIEADDDRLKTLLAELKGKDINEVCRQDTYRIYLHGLSIFPSSSSPRVAQNWRLFPAEVVAVVVAAAELPLVDLALLLRRLRRRRKKKRRRSRMMTWDSVYSTKLSLKTKLWSIRIQKTCIFGVSWA